LLCANCHADPTTQALTGKRMADAPLEFGVIYSTNITAHPTRGIGRWTDGELAYLLRTGVKRDGQYTPPYMVKLPHLSDEDLASILVFLRSDDPMVAPADVPPVGVTRPTFLTKLLSHVVFRKLPYPKDPIVAPPLTDRVPHGRYLISALECYACHSADFKTMNVVEPEKSVGFMGGGNPTLDLQGIPIRTANLTADDETGIGRWTEQDLRRALQQGLRPDGSLIRYPMAPMPQLSDDEVGAIYAYLRSIPKLHNAVPRALPPPPVASAVPETEGKRLFAKYGCVSCHGQDGVGLADIRQAAAHFPNREQLKAYIRNAPKERPGSRMPPWEGIVAEADYQPLIDHVLSLGKPLVSR
jgi:mono/diheme cytochrome c family protein